MNVSKEEIKKKAKTTRDIWAGHFSPKDIALNKKWIKLEDLEKYVLVDKQKLREIVTYFRKHNENELISQFIEKEILGVEA